MDSTLFTFARSCVLVLFFCDDGVVDVIFAFFAGELVVSVGCCAAFRFEL